MTENDKLNRQIIAGNIDSDPIGKNLTPEAREQAIQVGLEAFKGWTGNGPAAQIGIKAVTSRIFKK